MNYSLIKALKQLLCCVTWFSCLISDKILREVLRSSWQSFSKLISKTKQCQIFIYNFLMLTPFYYIHSLEPQVMTTISKIEFEWLRRTTVSLMLPPPATNRRRCLFFCPKDLSLRNFWVVQFFPPEFYDRYRPSFSICFSWHKRSPRDLTRVSFTSIIKEIEEDSSGDQSAFEEHTKQVNKILWM